MGQIAQVNLGLFEGAGKGTAAYGKGTVYYWTAVVVNFC
jgi:hypothetical protein